MNSLMIERTVEFLLAFDKKLGDENNNPLMNLCLEFMYIILYFLLFPIWLTNMVLPVKLVKTNGKRKGRGV